MPGNKKRLHYYVVQKTPQKNTKWDEVTWMLKAENNLFSGNFVFYHSRVKKMANFDSGDSKWNRIIEFKNLLLYGFKMNDSILFSISRNW